MFVYTQDKYRRYISFLCIKRTLQITIASNMNGTTTKSITLPKKEKRREYLWAFNDLCKSLA